jgi:hypothetical protein
MFGQLVKLSGVVVTLVLVSSCSKGAKTASPAVNGVYVLNLPTLNQDDRIVIEGARWSRDVTDNHTKVVVFHERGVVGLSCGGDFTLEGFTMRFDYLRPACETVEIVHAYSTALKVHLDNNASDSAIVYDDEYGYVYTRIRNP